MRAWVIREERHGSPTEAMRIEQVPKPRADIGEVIVRVKSAGINFNHIWACKGQPVPVSRLHPEEPMHIGGSDASGIIDEIGLGVKNWKIGDHVIMHPNQSCGQCVACNGFEPLSCTHQKAWGFETAWGSFAEYTKVQAQQLLTKPNNLSWDEASCFGTKLLTVYRMLVVNGQIKPQDRVLIWGAAGGLGSYAIKLCKAMGAIPVCVVSSAEKEEYCRRLGAEIVINRTEFPYLNSAGNAIEDFQEMKNFRSKLRSLTGGYDPDIVFEHVGANTFPTSVYVARKLGKIIICGATSGYQLTFDVRYLWMHQKQIIGSHAGNAHDAKRASLMVENGLIEPTLTKVFSFEKCADAHEELLSNRHMGSWAVSIS